MLVYPSFISSRLSFRLLLLVSTLIGGAVAHAQQFDEKSRVLLDRLQSQTGDYNRLLAKRDVQLKYVYHSLTRGQNITMERHIYDGEHSWATYQTHFIKEFDSTAGHLENALVDGQTYATVGGEVVTGEAVEAAVNLHRRVNFYWLTMMYKLRDPGTQFRYLGKHEENGVIYDKVHLTFDDDVIKKRRNDQYVLCFNPDTNLVDIFFWSGGTERPLDKLMKTTVEHQFVEGIYVPAVRKNYRPAKSGKVGEFDLMTVATFTEVQFNNGFSPQDFLLE